MKRIVTYKMFESAGSDLTQEQKDFLDTNTSGSWSYNSQTGLVNVDGDFNCSNEKLVDMHGVKFGRVSGRFDCSFNKITSLEGAPSEVGTDFFCLDNRLTSLIGSPRKINGTYYCYDNRLTSLEGSPEEVTGDYYCDMNDLISLEGAPRKIGGAFACEAFTLGEGEWNLTGWLKILRDGSEEAQELILTLISPDILNREISKDPSGMIRTLQGVWNEPVFQEMKSQLEFPREYGDVDKMMRSLNRLDDIKDLI